MRTCLLLLIVCGIVVCGCTPADVPPASASVPTPPAAEHPAPTPPQPDENAATSQPRRENAYAYRLAGMDCLVSAEGILRKVLIIRRGIRASPVSGGDMSASAPLKFFLPYYVFEVETGEGDEPVRFLIGSTPSRESILGWVTNEVVAPWDNVVGVRVASRTPVLVYPTFEAVEERLTTGSTPTRPIARASFDDRPTWMPFPVSERRLITHQQRTWEALRIHFLGRFPVGGDLRYRTANANQPSYTPDEIEQIKQGVRCVDLVACVDNTASTHAFIDEIRAAILSIARDVGAAKNVSLRVGLVLFRDYVPEILFPGDRVTQVRELTDDLATFCADIEQLGEATSGSEGLPEAAYDGIDVALEQMNWSDDLLTTRAIVLIGDNSAHEPGEDGNPRNLTRQALAARARERRTPIFSLAIDGRGDEQERNRHRDQFRSLAKDTGGEFHRLKDAGLVATKIREIAERHAQLVQRRIRGIEQLTGRAPDAAAASTPESGDDEFSSVMEFLSQSGIDPSRFGTGPSSSTGWIITENADGTRLVESHHYLARGELEMLCRELERLARECRPNLGHELIATIVGTSLDPRSFFAAPARRTPMDVYLQSRQIPCPNQSLSFSREELDQFGEEERIRLAKLVLEKLPELHRLLTDDRVFRHVGDGIDMGWVPSVALP